MTIAEGSNVFLNHDTSRHATSSIYLFFPAGIDKSADHTLYGALSYQRLQVRCPPIPDHASLLSFMYTHRTIPHDRVPRSCSGHSVELHHSDDLPVNRIQLAVM